MKFYMLMLLGLCCMQCVPQDYDDKLSKRLSEIRELHHYDSKIIFATDTMDYNDLSFAYWKPEEIYYEGDIARYKYRHYVAVRDTRGQRPDTARTFWLLQFDVHPSLFLRDTARTEDLKHLLHDSHVYVKMYAFASLSFRNEGTLFSTITENLADTTKILAMWGDAGDYMYPGDLMIQYESPRLSESEKKRLEDLIMQKYQHLTLGLEILRDTR